MNATNRTEEATEATSEVDTNLAAVSEVEAVETVLDFGIDWLKLVKSYLRIVLDSNR